MANPVQGIVYHASPKDNLHKVGLDPTAQPRVTRRISGWIYLGSDRYITDQYLRYAQKDKYFIYQIDTNGLTADDTTLAGEQQRYGKAIQPTRVKLVGTIDTSKRFWVLEAV